MIKKICIITLITLTLTILYTACNQSIDADNAHKIIKDSTNFTDEGNIKTAENSAQLNKNEVVSKIIKEYDSRYLESLKNLESTDFKDIFIDNSDTLIARRKFEKELLIRKNNKTQYSEYKIDYSFKGYDSFKFTYIDENHVKVSFHKSIKYRVNSNWNSQGIICNASLVNDKGNWKINYYFTDEDEYKFLDSLNGKDESEKYSMINDHYDDAIRKLH